MYLFILFTIISSFCFSANLYISIAPDSIYVGTITTITISINNLKKDEYPVYSNILENHDMYTVVDRKLTDHSVDYILQFWEVGSINIPSISVQIKKNKQDIELIQSDIIDIQILSNINPNSTSLRDIKAMYKINLIQPYKTFLYILLIFIGIILAIYLWKLRNITKSNNYQRAYYNKSIFEETIIDLKNLKIPNNINIKSTEDYYIQLSQIFRIFISKEYFIRATEMTSEELKIYFQSIGITSELINSWSETNQISDMSKYAGQIPTIDQFKRDKEYFINIIKSFHRIIPRND